MSSVEEPTDIYIVEKLVAFRYRGKIPEWRVRWQGYGAKDDTWETRKNLLMNSTFAFKHQMEQMEREYIEKRAHTKLGRAKDTRAAARPKRGRSVSSLYESRDYEQANVSESSSSSSSASYRESSSSSTSSYSSSSSRSSSSSGRHSGSDLGSSAVGHSSTSSHSRKRTLRARPLRRRRRCIDELLGGKSPQAPTYRGDPGLPASPDSEEEARKTSQLWSDGLNTSAPNARLLRPDAKPEESRGTLPSPTKTAVAAVDTPLRRLRLVGLEGRHALNGCASDTSETPSGRPSSSWKSSPEAESGPRVATGFTVSAPSDDDAGPFFLAGDAVGGSTGLAGHTQQEMQPQDMGREGGRPHLSPLQSFSSQSSPSGVNWSGGVSGRRRREAAEGERCFAARRVPPPLAAAAAASEGPCETPPATSSGQDSDFRMTLKSENFPETQEATAVTLPECIRESMEHEYPVDCAAAAQGAPTAMTTVGTTHMVLAVQTMAPEATTAPSLLQSREGARSASSVETSFGGGGPYDDLRQRQHQKHQQLAVASKGPLGVSKGMLNRYPCESLFPGRVRVVKIVRGEGGIEKGVKGAIVHYVIAASPGSFADPSRNVWGTCSIADARRFCPGALCDYLLRKALFRNGDKHSQKRNPSPGNTHIPSSATSSTTIVVPSQGTTQEYYSWHQQGLSAEGSTTPPLPAVTNSPTATEPPVEHSSS